MPKNEPAKARARWLRIDVVTALPQMMIPTLEASIIKRAQEAGAVEIGVHNLHDYGLGRYSQIDDAPFGGGAGMILRCEPVFACIEALQSEREYDEVIFLTPDGERLTQSIANELSLKRGLILLAGHYKGIDQRIRDTLVTREISIGDYVLTGGELPALVLLDAIVRLLPGAMSDAESALSDSFQNGLLDAPHYTRPAVFRSLAVPDVLLSGDHRQIAAWREQAALEKTRERRPDLLSGDADALL
jgi:tRNA (guanine37-N1)-methyltransferase